VVEELGTVVLVCGPSYTEQTRNQPDI